MYTLDRNTNRPLGSGLYIGERPNRPQNTNNTPTGGITTQNPNPPAPSHKGYA